VHKDSLGKKAVNTEAAAKNKEMKKKVERWAVGITRLDLALMDPTCTQRQPRKESSLHRNCSKNKEMKKKVERWAVGITRLDLALMDPTCTQRQPRKESSQHRNCSKKKRNEEKGSPFIKTREESQKDKNSERNEHTISTA
jgi:hypothetical protein